MAKIIHGILCVVLLPVLLLAYMCGFVASMLCTTWGNGWRDAP